MTDYFDEHVSNRCKKITNQFNVILKQISQAYTCHCIITPLQSIYITTLPVLFYRMAFL